MTYHQRQREFTRVPMHIWGTFADESGERLTGEVDSLSLLGCHVATFDALPADSRWHVTLFTEDEADALRFTVEGRIARSDADGMGVEFVELPIASYEHLKKLVLLNAPDPGQVEREFREHVGIRRAGQAPPRT